MLFRGGAEGRIRKALVEENLLDAVIGLPANCFFGTGIPAAILIFRLDRGKRTDVLFIDASRDYEQNKKQNKIREEVEVARIVETYRKRETINKYSYVAGRKEIPENDYNLNIPRNIDTFVEEEVDITAVQERIVSLEKELDQGRGEMAKCLQELGL